MDDVRYKRICSACAGMSLGQCIDSHGKIGACDYCGQNDKSVMLIADLLPRMYKSWELYYSNFDDSFFHEDFRTPYYLSDIIYDEVLELDDAREAFLGDLCTLPEERRWQKDSEYWTPFPEALKFSWQRFSSIVKTQWRYTYFLCGNDILDPASYSPLDVMNVICELLQIQNAFITELPATTCIYRNRKDNIKFCLNAKELGTSPSEYSKSNRFSPKGVPMFYGSLDEATCKIESSGNGKYSVTGMFYNAKPIPLLDLTNIPPIPKLYDDNFCFIPAYKFLHEFSNEISKDVVNDELEYIPTQVFTEYIRMQGLRQFNIKGIKYKSSKKSGGKNLVLFYTNDECKDEDDGTDCLVLDKII